MALSGNPHDDSGYPPQVIEHFTELQAAEAISLEEMLTTFLQGPLAALAFESDDEQDEDEEQLAQRLMELLALYWEWSEGLDPEAAMARGSTPEFAEAMAAASQRSEEDLQPFIESIREHYEALRQAESISQEQMLTVFLQGPLMPEDEDAFAQASSDESIEDHIAMQLGQYWEWSEGLDHDAVNARLASAQFMEDLERALARVESEGEPPSLH